MVIYFRALQKKSVHHFFLYRGGGKNFEQIIKIKEKGKSACSKKLNDVEVILPKTGEKWYRVDYAHVIPKECENASLLQEIIDNSSEAWGWSEVGNN